MINFVNLKNNNSLNISVLNTLSLQNVNMGGGIYSTKITLLFNKFRK